MLEEGQTNKQESENSKEEILPLELEAEVILLIFILFSFLCLPIQFNILAIYEQSNYSTKIFN